MPNLPTSNSEENEILKGSISDLKAVVKSLKQISHDNRLTLRSVFYDTIKLTLFRQQRLQKPALAKQEISKLLNLSHFLNVTHACAEAKGELGTLGDISEPQAKEFFFKEVQGTVCDSLGRKVEIPEKAVRCIYKDYQDGGKHNPNPTAYEAFRGKTLAWIRYTLQNSKKILSRNESTVVTFFYCMDFKLFYRDEIGIEKTERVTFLVVAKKEKKSILQPIVFVTSFRFKDYNRFLKAVEKFTPCNK